MFDKYQKVIHRVVDYSDLEDFINEIVEKVSNFIHKKILSIIATF